MRTSLRSPLVLLLFALSVIAVIALSQPRDQGTAGGGPAGSPVSESLGNEEAEVHASLAASRVVLVLDDTRQLCADLLGWPGRDAHLVCDVGKSDPQGVALRSGLRRLRQEVGQPLKEQTILLLASGSRGADLRALVSQDPAFFSRSAIWTEGQRSVSDLFGPSFLHHVASRGAQRLLIIGASEREYAPWLRLAGRLGMSMEATRQELGVETVVERLSEPRAGLGGPPPDAPRGIH